MKSVSRIGERTGGYGALRHRARGHKSVRARESERRRCARENIEFETHLQHSCKPTASREAAGAFVI